MTSFTDTEAATRKLAELLGFEKPKGRAIILPDGDGSITINMTGSYSACRVRATVFAGDGFSSDKRGWKAIKVKENRVADGYRSRVESHEADLAELAEKLRPMVTALSGYGAKLRTAKEQETNRNNALRQARRPVVEALVLGDLATFNDRSDWSTEQNKKDATVESHPERKYRLRCFGDEIEVTAKVPYAKAEKILAFLKEELG